LVYTLWKGPIQITPEALAYTSELWVSLLISTLIGLAVFMIGRKLGLIKAFILLIVYILFVYFIIARVFGFESVAALGDALQAFFNRMHMQ